eukprot:126363-Chlamydomonas_euryale.AAC.1
MPSGRAALAQPRRFAVHATTPASEHCTHACAFKPGMVIKTAQPLWWRGYAPCEITAALSL